MSMGQKDLGKTEKVNGQKKKKNTPFFYFKNPKL